ncbi:LCP family protein, partial [Frankia sp. Cr2]|uniref:LCP family protein n=1 Tax=Frankia sp. Cr2 TaxID=3073932 RepID=UPI002AD2434D
MTRDAVTRDAVLPASLNPRVRAPDGSSTWGASRVVSRLLQVVFALLSVVVLVASVGGWVLYSHLNGKITRVDLGLTGQRPTAPAHGVENYLLVGTDSRAGAGGAYGDAPGQRSDTTIVVHLAADGTSTMVSFPRDTLVTIPEYTDTNGHRHGAHRAKFNSAIADGGPSLLVNMVERLTDIRIDHYVSMDLEGFRAITDAIGGVAVCVLPSTYRDVFYDNNVRKVSTNTNDPMSGFLGGPGTVQVDGRQALAFVRQRHGLPEQDLDRIRRQQQFIGAVFRKAMASGVLTSPVKLEALLSSATSALTLDSHTSIADLRGLATRMRDVATGSIQSVTLPTHAPTRAEGGIGDSGELPGLGAVQIYDPTDLDRIVAPLRAPGSGTEASPSPLPSVSGSGSGASSATPTVSADQITVAVYNGSTVAGLASRAATELIRHGFRASNEGNASLRSHTSSTVVYGPGQDGAARTLQAAVPGSVLQRDPTAIRLELIVGSSFTGVVAGAAGSQPTGAGSAATTGADTAAAASAHPTTPVPAAAP